METVHTPSREYRGRSRGLSKETSNRDTVQRYQERSTVKLFFDGASFEMVKQLAQTIARGFKLGVFTIFRTGDKHYQVVYSQKASWNEKIMIVSQVYLESSGQKTRKRFTVRCTKEDAASKQSRKKRKPPKILYRSTRKTKK